MATHEERLALLTEVQKKAGFSDKGEAERFLMYWEALLPTIPAASGEGDSAMVMLKIVPSTDATKQLAAEIADKSLELVKVEVCPTS